MKHLYALEIVMAIESPMYETDIDSLYEHSHVWGAVSAVAHAAAIARSALMWEADRFATAIAARSAIAERQDQRVASFRNEFLLNRIKNSCTNLIYLYRQ